MGGKSAPAFPLYAADFLTDTAEWENDEVGCYARLLCQQWENKHLPADVKTLAKISLTDRSEFVPMWERRIGEKFVQREDGRLENPRLAEERDKSEAWSKAQSKRAKVRWDRARNGGGKSRKGATADTSGDATADTGGDATVSVGDMPSGCFPLPLSSPSSSSLSEKEGKKEGTRGARKKLSRFVNDIRRAPEKWKVFPQLPDEANPEKYERIECPVEELWDKDWDDHALWFREIYKPSQLALIFSSASRAATDLQVTYGPRTGERIWQMLSSMGLVVWCGICPRARK